MTKTISLTMAAVALVLAGLVSESGAADRDPVANAQPDLQKKVAVLEEKVEALEEQMRAIDTWFQGLPMAAQRLNSGLAQVRSEGFTKAGANLGARETLLDTVGNLGQGLTAELPSLGTKKKKDR